MPEQRALVQAVLVQAVLAQAVLAQAVQAPAVRVAAVRVAAADQACRARGRHSPLARCTAYALCGCAAALMSLAAASAEDAPDSAAGARAPDLGAGPHRNWSAQSGGDGAQPREGAPQPKIPLPVLPEEKNGAGGSGSSGGSSVEPAASPKPSSGQSKEDERRATERNNKAKQRPGYQEEAPMPRASASSSKR